MNVILHKFESGPFITAVTRIVPMFEHNISYENFLSWLDPQNHQSESLIDKNTLKHVKFSFSHTQNFFIFSYETSPTFLAQRFDFLKTHLENNKIPNDVLHSIASKEAEIIMYDCSEGESFRDDAIKALESLFETMKNS